MVWHEAVRFGSMLAICVHRCWPRTRTSVGLWPGRDGTARPSAVCWLPALPIALVWSPWVRWLLPNRLQPSGWSIRQLMDRGVDSDSGSMVRGRLPRRRTSAILCGNHSAV